MTGRWIITGANGYLGGELCRGLHGRGYSVEGFVRAGKAVDSSGASGIPCHGYEEFPSVVSEEDTVVHCAGITDSPGAWDEFVRTNVDWSLSLFEQAAERGAGCFVYVSSVAALGYRNRPGVGVLDESSAPRLVGGEFYGRSKWLAEQALLERAENSATRLVILRPGLIYGNRPFAPSQTWVKRGTVVDPDQRVPLVHVGNFLDALDRVVSHPEAGGVFFVVDDEQPTLRELNMLRIRCGMMGYHPWRIGRTGFWLLSVIRCIRSRGLFSRSRMLAEYVFCTRHMRYSTGKLRALTGWAPSVNLNDALRECRKASSPLSSRN